MLTLGSSACKNLSSLVRNIAVSKNGKKKQHLNDYESERSCLSPESTKPLDDFRLFSRAAPCRNHFSLCHNAEKEDLVFDIFQTNLKTPKSRSEKSLFTCATESNEPTVFMIKCLFNECSSGKTEKKCQDLEPCRPWAGPELFLEGAGSKVMEWWGEILTCSEWQRGTTHSSGVETTQGREKNNRWSGKN